MRVTTKGQVTIPIEIREKLGIFPNTEVDFIVRGNSAHLVKVEADKHKKSRGAAIVERLSGTATDRSLSTDQIMALMRGDD
ncbi:MAG: AbrB/MazE/SpoVT family DNA-binding domain-containing protein [Pyrinomonadaceae bacterium]